MRRFMWTVGFIAALSLSVAQAQGDPPRLVQNERGALYVLMAGQRWPINAPTISGDELAAIPEGGFLADGVIGTTAPQSLTAPEQPLPPPAPAPARQVVQARPAEQPQQATTTVRGEGSGSQNTKSFDLDAGDYRARYSGGLNGGETSCWLAINLRRTADNRSFGLIVNETTNRSRGGRITGETRLYAVPRGEYYFDVGTTGCSWNIRLDPE